MKSFLIITILISSLCPALSHSAETSPAHKTWREPITDMEFVWVPAGDGFIGVNPERYVVPPLQKVTLEKGFWMGKYEVTQKEWYTLMDTNPSEHKGNRLPVDNVIWLEAQEFIEKMNAKSPYTFRLPTQIEWEFAARGGTATTRYWGDSEEKACEYANVRDESNKKEQGWDGDYFDCNDGYPFSAPVGSFKPNQFGLHDMIGNVAEWCIDSCDGNPNRSFWNFFFPKEKVQCFIRGGELVS